MANMMILIFDGISDRPVKDLDYKTPLEVAETPNLDSAAERGINGIMDTIKPGVIPGSDTGHLAILGYDPYEVYTGRGPFEAAGLDMDMEPGHVAFRCNFSTLEDDIVVDRRAGRIKEGTDRLAKVLNEIELGVDFLFKEGVEHRGVLIIKDSDLGAKVSDVDPHMENASLHTSSPIIKGAENERTSQLINKFTEMSIDVLSKHPVNLEREEKGLPPANVVLSRGAGVVPVMDSLMERANIHGAAIAGIPLVRGVCKMAGMDIISVEGATGGLDTDIEAIIDSSVSEVQKHDLLIVNIKGPDLLGHDGDAEAKVDFIEKIDSKLGVLEKLEDVCIAYTSDHSTPVTVNNHSGDPVPITITGEGVRKDRVSSFDERSCGQGGLARIRGTDVLNIMLDLVNKAEKFGA